MCHLQVAKAKASKSTTGRVISAVSFNRKQFGARKKIEYAHTRPTAAALHTTCLLLVDSWHSTA